MASSFGWLDNDDEQRRRMIEVVELFREQGTVDELGIGSIRDTLSNAMFPGTSTLHTRLRYVLFLPWLMQQAARTGTAQEMAANFTALEYRLIDSLLAGGEQEGVMGNVARHRLKRLPSIAYWGALGSWGVIDARSTEAFFRRQVDSRRLAERTASPDDVDARELVPSTGLDPDLPRPPQALLKETAFALSPDEEDYLSERISTSAKGTLLAWLISHRPANLGPDAGEGEASYPWEVANVDDLPEELAVVVEHARRFSAMVQGATLVYNVTLARRGRRDDRVAEHEAALAGWRAAEDPQRTASTWPRDAWWTLVLDLNPQVRPGTRFFLDQWLDLVASGADLRTDPAAERLVANRERQIKGGRARFANQSALDRWSGSSGSGRLDFRWGVTRSHLNDLYAARASA